MANITIRQAWHQKILLYSCILLALVFPFGKAPVAIGAALIFINWLMEGNFKVKFYELKSNTMFWVFTSLYWVFLVGMINTQNTSFGWFDLQIKLSLLLMPLVFFTSKMNYLYDNRFKIYIAFIISCIIAGFVCLIQSVINYTDDIHVFYYVSLSKFIHPAYFSMYLNLALILILFELNQLFIKSYLYKIILILIILLFSFLIVLLSSKIGILCLLLIFIAFVYHQVFTKKKYYAGITAILFMFLFSMYLLFFAKASLERFKQASYAILQDEKVNPGEGTAVRIKIWNAAWELIKEEPITGYGTGDVKDILVYKYEKLAIVEAYKYKLNAHNQFFQNFVAVGILGFISLLLSLIISLVLSIKHRNYVYALFTSVVFLNMFVESIIETQAGVVFYAFFNSLFFVFVKLNMSKSNS